MGVQKEAVACEVCQLGGSGGMPPRKILDFRSSEIVCGAIWNKVIMIASTLESISNETALVSDTVKRLGMCAHFSQVIFWVAQKHNPTMGVSRRSSGEEGFAYGL